mmetsp:Transcript_13670/g.28087  ORF Transcript_13670/g.28087 Transcript_13670/m.28087 type:complete len:341 (-) Transcript_13670:1287-2309(-)
MLRHRRVLTAQGGGVPVRRQRQVHQPRGLVQVRVQPGVVRHRGRVQGRQRVRGVAESRLRRGLRSVRQHRRQLPLPVQRRVDNRRGRRLRAAVWCGHHGVLQRGRVRVQHAQLRRQRLVLGHRGLLHVRVRLLLCRRRRGVPQDLLGGREQPLPHAGQLRGRDLHLPGRHHRERHRGDGLLDAGLHSALQHPSSVGDSGGSRGKQQTCEVGGVPAGLYRPPDEQPSSGLRDHDAPRGDDADDRRWTVDRKRHLCTGNRRKQRQSAAPRHPRRRVAAHRLRRAAGRHPDDARWQQPPEPGRKPAHQRIISGRAARVHLGVADDGGGDADHADGPGRAGGAL